MLSGMAGLKYLFGKVQAGAVMKGCYMVGNDGLLRLQTGDQMI